MRAMLTCRDTQGRLRGLSPGAGSGSELAEPLRCPGEPLGGAELQAQLPRAPAHPPRAAHLHGPQRRFSVHPKDVRPAKETQSGSELWPSCQCPYPHGMQTRGHHWCRSCCSPLQFARAASALGISHSRGCSHRHLSMDLVLECCSTSLEQLHCCKKWPQAAASSSHFHPCIPTSWQS